MDNKNFSDSVSPQWIFVIGVSDRKCEEGISLHYLDHSSQSPPSSCSSLLVLLVPLLMFLTTILLLLPCPAPLFLLKE